MRLFLPLLYFSVSRYFKREPCSYFYESKLLQNLIGQEKSGRIRLPTRKKEEISRTLTEISIGINLNGIGSNIQ